MMIKHSSRRVAGHSRRSVVAQDAEFDDLRAFARAFQEKRLVLDLAGMFFISSVDHAKRGDECYQQLSATLRAFRNVFARLGSLRLKRVSRRSLKGVTDDDLVNSLQNIRRLEVLYGPVVSEYTLATIAAIASAESFINEVADIVIGGRTAREYFDKLPVQAKWLFLPALIGKPRLFRLDQNPLQAFAKAVRHRNALIHFKGSGQPLGASEVPPFLEDLGLLPKRINESIDAVRD